MNPFKALDFYCFFYFPYSKVSVSKARAIIVLASDENADQVLSHCPFAILIFTLSEGTFLISMLSLSE